MKNNKQHYIVIAHDIHTPISDREIYEALEAEASPKQIEILNFDIRLELGSTMGFGWQARKTKQFQFFQKTIQPKLDANPEAIIVYFGIAPIPLAIHLGYLVSGLRNVRVFQKHHDEKYWKWEQADSLIEIITEDVPNDYYKGKGEVVLRCSATYPVHKESVQDIVNDPIKETVLSVRNPERDIFTSEESLKEYASAFRGILDKIANALPGVDTIHLFGGLPTGLAFLIGQEIQKNIHPDIAVYDYKRDEIPCYQQVFLVQRDPIVERNVPEEKKPWIRNFRSTLHTHLQDDIKAFVETLQDRKGENWIDELFVHSDGKEFFHTPYWKNLAPLCETRLLKSNFSDQPFDDEESQFFVSNKWYLSDSLIHTLHTRIPDEEDLKSAFRLFWFHEVIHDRSHGLNSGNTEGIGRYPKIIEEADYQADVYALLHEYEFMSVRKNKVIDFFQQRIELAIYTMWAFDDLNPGPRMQVRRIGRYLIWYFQLLRITDYCETFDDILKAFSEKPLIELRMVGVTSPDNERLELELEGYKKEQLGIAIFYKNRFTSLGHGNGQLSLDVLMDGFRHRDHEKIKGVMRQFMHIIAPLPEE